MHMTLADDRFSEAPIAFWDNIPKIPEALSPERWLAEEINIFSLTMFFFSHFNESWKYPDRTEVALISSSMQLLCPIT